MKKCFLLTGILMILLIATSGIAGDKPKITFFHGSDRLQENAFKHSGKYFADARITSATAVLSNIL